jgi:sigma-B regulation protein RsbU (phosphoserine phosphatase)
MQSPHHYTNARILIVDDDRVNRHLIRALLSTKGYTHIFEAADGIEALAMKKQHNPNLILLDLHMPHLSGFDVCRIIRRDHDHDDIPILVITQMDSSQDRAAAFDAGATDLITKPVHKGELLARVSIHLGHQFLTQDLMHYQKRVAHELRRAYEIQRSLLPSSHQIQTINGHYGLSIEGYCHPCTELGGDMWHVSALDGHRVLMSLVDFSGHGVHAALHTVWLQAYMGHHPMGAEEHPDTYLLKINKALKAYMPLGHFATMIVMVLDTQQHTLTYASAAHPQLIVWDAKGRCTHIAQNQSLPLGIVEDAAFEAVTVPLPEGGSFFAYSDGLLHPDLCETPFTESSLNTLAHQSAPEFFLDLIKAYLNVTRPHHGPDDNTFLFVSRGGEEALAAAS